MTQSPGRSRRVAGVLIVAMVLLAGCTGGGGGLGSQASGDGGQLSASGQEGGGGGSYYEGGDRVIIRDAYMRVEVDSFGPAFDEARRIARAHGGFVAGWDHQIERGWEQGEVQIRVPAGNFSAIRDDLATLGRLENERVQARDFTGEYEDITARLEGLRSDERSLERLLNRTDNPDEVRQILDDLSQIRREIRELERQKARIESQEALSTIHLTLVEPESDRPPANYRSAFGFDDAFLDAFYGGLLALKYGIVAIGYAIPIGAAAILVGGFAFACFRLWQRLAGRLDAVLGGGGVGPFSGGGTTEASEGEADPAGDGADDAEAADGDDGTESTDAP